MFDKSKTASFDVDAQYTFTPTCPDELPVPGGDEIAGALNEQNTFASFRVGCKDAHPEKAEWTATEAKPQFAPYEGKADIDIHWKPHGRPGTKGFELLEGLPAPEEYNYFVWKGVEPSLHPYGGCYHTQDWKKRRLSTGVIEVLKVNGIENVIVGGLATDYCVKETALQLRDAGFNVILNLNACRGIAPDTIASALAEMREAGVIVVDNVATANLFMDHEETLGL